MIDQMSKREKTLALLVGGAIFIVFNVVAIKLFMNKHATLKAGSAEIQRQINAYKAMDAGREFARERDAWITEKLVPIGDPQVAARQLVTTIRDVARKSEVVVETVQEGQPKPGSAYASLGAKVVVKGTWKSILYFVQELQALEQFIVFEPLEMKVDATDKSMMRAEVMATRWFKP